MVDGEYAKRELDEAEEDAKTGFETRQSSAWCRTVLKAEYRTDGLCCSRKVAHTGDHVAWGSAPHLMARWPQVPPAHPLEPLLEKLIAEQRALRGDIAAVLTRLDHIYRRLGER